MSVVVYIGISLDGYIATRDDDLQWLLNTQGCGDNGFGAFYDTVDAVMMSRRTYDWIMAEENGRFPYVGKECYVYTSHPAEDTPDVRFTAQDPEALIGRLKAEGKNVWVVGGSQIIDLVRKQHLVDEYILNIAPVILGDGIPLFCLGDEENLVMERVQTFGQFVEIRYRSKNNLKFPLDPNTVSSSILAGERRRGHESADDRHSGFTGVRGICANAAVL